MPFAWLPHTSSQDSWAGVVLPGAETVEGAANAPVFENRMRITRSILSTDISGLTLNDEGYD